MKWLKMENKRQFMEVDRFIFRHLYFCQPAWKICFLLFICLNKERQTKEWMRLKVTATLKDGRLLASCRESDI